MIPFRFLTSPTVKSGKRKYKSHVVLCERHFPVISIILILSSQGLVVIFLRTLHKSRLIVLNGLMRVVQFSRNVYHVFELS